MTIDHILNKLTKTGIKTNVSVIIAVVLYDSQFKELQSRIPRIHLKSFMPDSQGYI